MAKTLGQQLLEQKRKREAKAAAAPTPEQVAEKERDQLSDLLEKNSPGFDQQKTDRPDRIESTWSEADILETLGSALEAKIKLVLPQLVEQQMLGGDLKALFEESRAMDRVIFEKNQQHLEQNLQKSDERLNQINERLTELSQQRTEQNQEALSQLQEAKKALEEEKHRIQEGQNRMRMDLKTAQDMVANYSQTLEESTAEVVKGTSLASLLWGKMQGQFDEMKIALLRHTAEEIRQLNIKGLTDGINAFMKRLEKSAEAAIAGMDEKIEAIMEGQLKNIDRAPSKVLEKTLAPYPDTIKEKGQEIVDLLHRSAESILNQLQSTGEKALENQIEELARQNHKVIEKQLGISLSPEQVEKMITAFLTQKLDGIETLFTDELQQLTQSVDFPALMEKTLIYELRPYLEGDESRGIQPYRPNEATKEIVQGHLQGKNGGSRYSPRKAHIQGLLNFLNATEDSGNEERFEPNRVVGEVMEKHLKTLESTVARTADTTVASLEKMMETIEGRLLQLLEDDPLKDPLEAYLQQLNTFKAAVQEEQATITGEVNIFLGAVRSELGRVAQSIRNDTKAVLRGFETKFDQLTEGYQASAEKTEAEKEAHYQERLAALEKREQNFNSLIKATEEALETSFKTLKQQLELQVKERKDQLEQSSNEKTEQTLKQLQQEYDHLKTLLTEQFSNRETELEKNYQEKERELIEHFDRKKLQLSDEFDQQKEQLEARYAEKEAALQTHYNEQEARLTEVYRQRSIQLKAMIDDKKAQLEREIQETIEIRDELKGNIEAERAEQEKRFNQRLRQMENALNKVHIAFEAEKSARLAELDMRKAAYATAEETYKARAQQYAHLIGQLEGWGNFIEARKEDFDGAQTDMHQASEALRQVYSYVQEQLPILEKERQRLVQLESQLMAGEEERRNTYDQAIRHIHQLTLQYRSSSNGTPTNPMHTNEFNAAGATGELPAASETPKTESKKDIHTASTQPEIPAVGTVKVAKRPPETPLNEAGKVLKGLPRSPFEPPISTAAPSSGGRIIKAMAADQPNVRPDLPVELKEDEEYVLEATPENGLQLLDEDEGVTNPEATQAQHISELLDTDDDGVITESVILGEGLEEESKSE